MPKVEEVASPGGNCLVMRIVWNGIPPEACYGPWQIAADGSHLRKAQEFLDRWRKKNGEPSSVTIYSVFAPGEIDDLQPPEV